MEAAHDAGLRYVSDDRPGLRRRRSGRGFVYLDTEGRAITSKSELRRIRDLAIPPAWTDVWISPDPLGHIQATGRDARRRKQYRYHERWREVRDETKYERMLDFAKVLPRIRKHVDRDLARPHLTRERVLATVVRLLETSLIRIGNDEYARANSSYGLTTLREKHVRVVGGRVTFRFRGKSGQEHEVGVQDARVARVIRRLQELPGQELFRYVDETGEARTVDSADVNAYLRQVAGEDFTAKDFRTWAGTVFVARELCALGRADGPRGAKRNVTQAVKAVAKRLGNTPAVCRRGYIHPAIVQAYLDGKLERPTERAILALLRPSGRARP
ncbi:MAG TPA: DNA topoisomerase IB [Candidatus Limnocylindria bacterium]|nr:DNA topoisomerase IB [Candidatus Limnocylindria bacterium]